MIFVTVGGQLPFDRLIRTVDAWAGKAARTDVFCQILDGEFTPQHCEWEREIAPADFQARLDSAQLIIAHAGMGTIISALEHRTPVLVMPRRAALREQRNDHQLATAMRFAETGKIAVAMDEEALRVALDRLDDITAPESIGDRASEELIDAVREFALR